MYKIKNRTQRDRKFIAMQIIYLIAISFILSGYGYRCDGNRNIRQKASTSYNIEIDYSSINKNDKRNLAGGDSVAIGFVGTFLKDTVEISKNNKFYKTAILTSDDQTDDAGHIYLDRWQTLDNVGIRINGGPLIFIETRRQGYHINLRYDDDKINVKFYKYLPATY